MSEASIRLESLVGNKALETLKRSSVLVVGVGGVGSYAAEALARSFIGKIILLDMDNVSVSNLNRQLLATLDTIGRPKVEVMKERILSINPDCEVVTIQEFYKKENDTCFKEKVDYVVDAIDVLSSKMDLIEECHTRGIPCISSLGMGNRLDPSQIVVTTLDKTNYDPLAKALRQMVKKRNYRYKIPVVFSKEIPYRQAVIVDEEGKTRKEKLPPSSSAFVPSAAGLVCASVVVRKLIEGISNE